MSSQWSEAQAWESEWHGSCVNTFAEEAKQLVYAPRMGLTNQPRDGRWPVYDLDGLDVIDVGGGPCSMLLKTVGGGANLVVADPLPYPSWTRDRYAAHGITRSLCPGEHLHQAELGSFDEAWIYNCLQHVDDPAEVVRRTLGLLRPGGVIRVFEWIDTETNVGHPHSLTAPLLDEWVHGSRQMPGRVEEVNDSGAVGRCWHGWWTPA